MQRDRPKWPLYVKKTMLSAKKNRPFFARHVQPTVTVPANRQAPPSRLRWWLSRHPQSRPAVVNYSGVM